MMNVGSARPIFNKLQTSVDCLFRRSWKKRLPLDYQNILSRAVPPLDCNSEDDFFSCLSDTGTLIDGGGMWFSLDDKERRKKCYVISAKKLAIIWSDDERYYQWKSSSESELYNCKFPEVAQLLQVCWLDIAGKIDSRDLSPKTNYGAYLILKFVDRNYGFDVQAAQISVKVGGTVKSGTGYLRPNKEKVMMKKRLQFLYHMQVLLTNPSESLQQEEIVYEDEDEEILQGISFPSRDEVAPKKKKRFRDVVVEDNGGGGGGSPKGAAYDRADHWMEIELGTFYIDGDDQGMVEMSLKETGVHWKGGLIIQGIEVRPLSTENKRKEVRTVDES